MLNTTVESTIELIEGAVSDWSPVFCNCCNQPILNLNNAWYGSINRFEMGYEHQECHCTVIVDTDYPEEY